MVEPICCCLLSLVNRDSKKRQTIKLSAPSYQRVKFSIYFDRIHYLSCLIGMKLDMSSHPCCQIYSNSVKSHVDFLDFLFKMAAREMICYKIPSSEQQLVLCICHLAASEHPADCGGLVFWWDKYRTTQWRCPHCLPRTADTCSQVNMRRSKLGGDVSWLFYPEFVGNTEIWNSTTAPIVGLYSFIHLLFQIVRLFCFSEFLYIIYKLWKVIDIVSLIFMCYNALCIVIQVWHILLCLNLQSLCLTGL